jgi:hypothetical protein
MTLGNMRALNDACRHVALIDVRSYPAETDPILQKPRGLLKCGSRGNKINVRPNWKEQPIGPSLAGKEWRMSQQKEKTDET